MDVLINGEAYDQSSVIFKANGKQYITAQDISFGTKVSVGTIDGNRTETVAVTAGHGEHKLGFSLAKQEADEYMSDLGNGWARKRHDVEIQFQADNSPTSVTRALACRIMDRSTDTKGTDGVMTKFELRPFRLFENGMSAMGEEDAT